MCCRWRECCKGPNRADRTAAGVGVSTTSEALPPSGTRAPARVTEVPDAGKLNDLSVGCAGERADEADRSREIQCVGHNWLGWIDSSSVIEVNL